MRYNKERAKKWFKHYRRKEKAKSKKAFNKFKSKFYD